MTAPKKPADRKAPAKEAAVDYGAAPALVITSDEMADLLRPYVFQLGDELYALKSPNSFSVEDFAEVNDLVAEDVTKVLSLVSFDERTEAKLGSVGLGIMVQIINGWRDAVEVQPGESEPSES